MYVPVALTRQVEIDAAIRQVQRSLGPDVVRIRYEIGQDWSDQWAIFFRVVLTDEAARRRLRQIAWTVIEELERRLDFPALAVHAYNNFRSVSEQEQLQEPAWA